MEKSISELPRVYPSWRKRIGALVGLVSPDEALPFVGTINADNYAARAAKPEIQAMIQRAQEKVEARRLEEAASQASE